MWHATCNGAGVPNEIRPGERAGCSIGHGGSTVMMRGLTRCVAMLALVVLTEGCGPGGGPAVPPAGAPQQPVGPVTANAPLAGSQTGGLPGATAGNTGTAVAG